MEYKEIQGIPGNTMMAKEYKGIYGNTRESKDI